LDGLVAVRFEGLAFEGLAFEGLAFEGLAFEGLAFAFEVKRKACARAGAARRTTSSASA